MQQIDENRILDITLLARAIVVGKHIQALERHAKLLKRAHRLACCRHLSETHTVDIRQGKPVAATLLIVTIEYIAAIEIARQYPLRVE